MAEADLIGLELLLHVNNLNEEDVYVQDGARRREALNAFHPTCSSHESSVVVTSGAPLTPIISSSSSGPPAYQNSTPTGAPLCPSSSSSGPTGKVEKPKARYNEDVHKESKKTSHSGTEKEDHQNQIRQDKTEDEKKIKGKKTASKHSPSSGSTPSQAAAHPRDTTGSVVSLKFCASIVKAAESKASTYEKSVQVTVPDSLSLKELQKGQREITRLGDHISRLRKEITNHANTISGQNEELYNSRDRISQLEAEVAALKAVITPAASNQFTKHEMDRTKMEMIVRNTLADVLYDLLKLYKKNLKQRSHYDITILYNELKTLNKHIPSNGWGSTWKRIKKSDIAIGDDIERIRLIRNELQHSGRYVINGKRFRVLCLIIGSLLERFDDRIKPRKLYTDQLNFYLAKTCS
ncbi:unnamed protein product [Mytilus coruscus]|uniref:Uncharacterized protein n=1 Tax=Mytilus coruscus TaxID=42192 RepID=A0A6J8D8E0_MYTCO|nr:unnamed protein product [Mytilus coruscus]